MINRAPYGALKCSKSTILSFGNITLTVIGLWYVVGKNSISKTQSNRQIENNPNSVRSRAVQNVWTYGLPFRFCSKLVYGQIRGSIEIWLKKPLIELINKSTTLPRCTITLENIGLQYVVGKSRISQKQSSHQIDNTANSVLCIAVQIFGPYVAAPSILFKIGMRTAMRLKKSGWRNPWLNW